MRDPNREELLEALEASFGPDLEELDREEAIYWFAANWHSGQWSCLYSVLSNSPFDPGPLARGPSEGMAREAYDCLEATFTAKGEVQ